MMAQHQQLDLFLEQKMCWKCNRCKPINQFKKKKNKLTTLCKKCHNKYYRGKNSKKNNIQKNRDYIKSILFDNSCKDCGYNFSWLALQFDHRNPEEKKYEISKLISSGRSLELLKKEIEKCDVVCANCHSIRTSKMFGSWRLLF